MLGNKDDASRQNAIVICAHKGLDAELTAPYLAQYVGINDFDLASHRESWWGYDADHKASNHFTGKFSISGSSGSTPIVNDRGAWKAGETYDYYDRVSYNGSLYLMTNKAAGTTTGVPGVSTDWTLQVSGDKRKGRCEHKHKGQRDSPLRKRLRNRPRDSEERLVPY